MVTDAELAEAEARLAVVSDLPPLLRTLAAVKNNPDLLPRLLAELRRLRGMKCETCGWWRNGCCDLMAGDGGEPEHPETLAYARDGEQYYAHVWTKPDFGCVCWGPKP